MIALCNKTAMCHSSEPSAWRLVLKIHLQPITLLEEERDKSPGVVVEESMKFQIHDMTPFRILHGLCYRGRCFKDRGSVGKSSVVSTWGRPGDNAISVDFRAVYIIFRPSRNMWRGCRWVRRERNRSQGWKFWSGLIYWWAWWGRHRFRSYRGWRCGELWWYQRKREKCR